MKRELAPLVADQFCRGFKYAGTCAMCGSSVPVGAPGWYASEPHKAVQVCVSCKPAPVAEPYGVSNDPDPFPICVPVKPAPKPSLDMAREAAIERIAKINALRDQVNASSGTAPAYSDDPLGSVPVQFPELSEEESHFAVDSEY